MLTARLRLELANDGRHIREYLEAIDPPRCWGAIGQDALQDVKNWQRRCMRSGVGSAAVFTPFEGVADHITIPDVILMLDEAIMALSPAPMVGG